MLIYPLLALNLLTLTLIATYYAPYTFLSGYILANTQGYVVVVNTF